MIFRVENKSRKKGGERLTSPLKPKEIYKTEKNQNKKLEHQYAD